MSLTTESPLCSRIARMNSQPARPPFGTAALPMRSPHTTAPLSGSPQTDHPEQRGAALLARGLVHQLSAIPLKATADVLAALNVWSLARAEWASSAMSDLAAALSGAGNGPPTRTGRRRFASPSAAAMWCSRLLWPASGDVMPRARESLVTAVALLEKSAELGRRAGDDGIVAKALVNLARVELDAGRGGHAMRNIGEALARDQRGELRPPPPACSSTSPPGVPLRGHGARRALP